MKKLRFWNGRGCGKYTRYHISVAAYSKKQAVEIINESCNAFISVNEITNYYSECWGNSMKNINIDVPCVYIEEITGTKTPIRIY